MSPPRIALGLCLALALHVLGSPLHERVAVSTAAKALDIRATSTSSPSTTSNPPTAGFFLNPNDCPTNTVRQSQLTVAGGGFSAIVGAGIAAAQSAAQTPSPTGVTDPRKDPFRSFFNNTDIGLVIDVLQKLNGIPFQVPGAPAIILACTDRLRKCDNQILAYVPSLFSVNGTTIANTWDTVICDKAFNAYGDEPSPCSAPLTANITLGQILLHELLLIPEIVQVPMLGEVENVDDCIKLRSQSNPGNSTLFRDLARGRYSYATYNPSSFVLMASFAYQTGFSLNNTQATCASKFDLPSDQWGNNTVGVNYGEQIDMDTAMSYGVSFGGGK
ncbi:MAG: hypothetical protein M1824_004241 [Vezdaea acicularis]|nr:MAG: hypothetical protein M1824_004241 [Vezdaea acicularis]